MTIKNPARLVLANPADRDNALCIVNCWAGPDNTPDITVETDPQTGAIMLVVDQGWCDTQGPLSLDGGATMLCPLADTQDVTTVVPCTPQACTSDVVYMVDLTNSPVVSATITGPVNDHLYTIHWGAGLLATTDVPVGTPVSVTYTMPGTFTVRVQDQTTGQYGYPTTVAVTTVPHTMECTCPGEQYSRLGLPVSESLSASSSNSLTTYTWKASDLPDGLTLLNLGAGHALIVGTPARAMTTTVTATATDAFGHSITCVFDWTVGTATTSVMISDPGAQSSTVGTPVKLTLTASDSDPEITSFTWKAFDLPAGLSIDAATGKISGTPTTGQPDFPVTVVAIDPNGAGARRTFSWSVATAVTVAKVSDQSFTADTAITPVQLSATDSDPAITDFSWSVSPDLPDGLTLDADAGTVTGTPTATAAKRRYTFTATDPLGASGSVTTAITVGS